LPRNQYKQRAFDPAARLLQQTLVRVNRRYCGRYGARRVTVMKLFLFLASLILSSASLAGDAKGKVTDLRASNTSNSVIFTVSAEIEDPASCNKWQMFGINLGTSGGQAVFELVKYAFLNELEVEVNGLGTCVAHWRSEDVKDVAIRKSTP